MAGERAVDFDTWEAMADWTAGGHLNTFLRISEICANDHRGRTEAKCIMLINVLGHGRTLLLPNYLLFYILKEQNLSAVTAPTNPPGNSKKKFRTLRETLKLPS